MQMPAPTDRWERLTRVSRYHRFMMELAANEVRDLQSKLQLALANAGQHDGFGPSRDKLDELRVLRARYDECKKRVGLAEALQQALRPKIETEMKQQEARLREAAAESRGRFADELKQLEI